MNTMKNLGKIERMTAFLLLIGAHGGAQEVKEEYFAMEQNLPIFFPLSVDDFVRFSSAYGYRKHPILHKIKKHNGIDIAASKGKPVYATAHGIVEKVDYDKGYGNRIVIKHREHVKTLYGHLNSQHVKVGQQVRQGDKIGEVGETGMATGPHLHYEVWIHNTKIDPMILWKRILNQERQVSLN